MTTIEREKILAFMNRGEWKHTQHMKRDWWNQIDMHNVDNIKLIIRNVHDARAEADKLNDEAGKVMKIMKKFLEESCKEYEG